MNICRILMPLFVLLLGGTALAETIFVFGEEIHLVTKPVIRNGVVVITDGKIQAVGPAAMVGDHKADRVIRTSVVVPGFVDARATVGLTGQFNHEHDQDHLDTSEAMQPELRAIDAYNWKERLVEWVRGFGVTTVHTGHSPGELISGQTCIREDGRPGAARGPRPNVLGGECDFGRRGTTVWKFPGEPIQGSRHVAPSHDCGRRTTGEARGA